jgi:tryptophan synthase alpha chain
MAATRALNEGVTVKKILNLVTRIRKKSQIPIILFTYLNPILKYGFKLFAKEAKQAGVDGILILDLPPEEADEYKKIMSGNEIDTIFLVAPTSSDVRVKKAAGQASGFIYCVSRTGVTGTQQKASEEVPALVQRIRSVSSLPIAVGFGISSAEQVAALSKISDAVVVGSAIVKRIEEHVSDPHLVQHVSKFVGRLARALREQ